jgi:NAD(P)-dependent dehydrogenase (short-subunit alcohol dehydrogenase family)
MDRPETIEETAALVDAAGGRGIAVQVDHLVPDQVRALVQRIDDEQGALDVLVNDIWGATTMECDKTVWESSLDIGLRTPGSPSTPTPSPPTSPCRCSSGHLADWSSR